MTGILVLGKNGQVGQELVRVFDDTRDVTAMGRAELDLANQDAIRTVLRALKPRIVINAAAFTAVDDQTGSPTWARTGARVTRALIEKYGEQLRDTHDIFHLAGSGAVSRHAFATELLRLLAMRYGENAAKTKRITAISSDEFKSPAARPRYSALSSDKLRSAFGIVLPTWQHDLAKFVSSTPDSTWA